jgi:hypothetical protein
MLRDIMRQRLMTIAATPSHPGTSGDLSVVKHHEYVEVRGHGLWSVSYLDTHFNRLDSTLQSFRTLARGAKVLVDLSGAAVQPPGTADRIAYWTARLYRESDRVAIVAASSLMKVQMRRTAMIARRELFLSRDAALAWLLSPATPVMD